ncbi:DUF5753 domain-containing protein [Saccharopolyspora sp. NPDC000359]|uniref:DUF5753 domain-containing protein n=1 Tax=Saccharopolyspora sp. NPDC000359 TaxID=3154251 RepID=UPI00332BBC18
MATGPFSLAAFCFDLFDELLDREGAFAASCALRAVGAPRRDEQDQRGRREHGEARQGVEHSGVPSGRTFSFSSAEPPEQRQQLSALLEFERTARLITHAAPLLIPGSLQSTAYVRAIMTAGGVPPEEVETRIAVRVGRREAIMRKDEPVHLKAAIGEAALRQVVGTPDVMVDQLDHLLQLSDLDNVDVRVVPFQSAWQPALEGIFVLIESDEAPPVVHLENRRSGLFLHEPADIAIYREAAETVFSTALVAAEPKLHIARVRKETKAER